MRKEYLICPDCGKQWICKQGKKCLQYNYCSKHRCSYCSNCSGANIGTGCEGYPEESKDWRIA